MDLLPEALCALNSYNQFVVYRLVASEKRPGKLDKLPINPQTQYLISALDPSGWMDFETASRFAKDLGHGHGVGFVFTRNDPFWFLDIDNCLQDNNTWSPLALELLGMLANAAVEISSSGRGLHIIGSGKIPPHSCRNAERGIELYSSDRFVALTGTNAMGNAGLDATNMLPAVIDKYFRPVESSGEGWTDGPCSGWNGPTDDEDLLRRALQSNSARSIFGGNASFADLWEANEEVLAASYPDPERSYNASSADAALAQHLAFWTGNDCERIQRLMERSALRRDKWDREDYLPRTIESACGRQKDWICDKPAQPNANPAPSQEGVTKAEIITGNTFLSVEEQLRHFAGCVYVTDEHKALIPGGVLINAERFRVRYGGRSLMMDSRNERTTRNAWEAFTESQAFVSPRADTTCFRPDLPAGVIIEKDGQTMANVWWPIKTMRKKGCVERFLRHIALLLPNKRDQQILICYLAAIIQYPGVKFQWCPVIQGVEGNGKTLLTRCVAFAVGTRYTHYPKAAELASRFNDWIYGRTFIAVEDIYTQDGRNEIMEAMKPMVTGERQEIESKGGAKVTRDVCANFLINTNHKDGLRKTRNDRRFAVFYTAQQTADDLIRDGMGGDYFPNIYEWLNDEGMMYVNEYLSTYDIPDEFNPATHCKRAPITSSTETAIQQGLGGVEQEIVETIEQGTAGFKNGWISSMALDRLLDKLNVSRRIPQNRRREVLQSLGYDWHPHLKDGRVNNTVLPDGGKPRLYIKSDNPAIGLTEPVKIAKAYTEDQK